MKKIDVISHYDIGEFIETVLREERISVIAFSKAIGVSRNVAYDIFKRKSINTDLLFKISIFLHHDFFQYISLFIEDSIKLKK